jgi:hypothetical protein
VVEVELEDCSEEEMTGARSSMQKTSDGKIVAQVHYASRLPRVAAQKDYLGRILLRFWSYAAEKCDFNHNIVVKIRLHYMITACELPTDRAVRCIH